MSGGKDKGKGTVVPIHVFKLYGSEAITTHYPGYFLQVIT
jgi:hypothetical protein